MQTYRHIKYLMRDGNHTSKTLAPAPCYCRQSHLTHLLKHFFPKRNYAYIKSYGGTTIYLKKKKKIESSNSLTYFTSGMKLSLTSLLEYWGFPYRPGRGGIDDSAHRAIYRWYVRDILLVGFHTLSCQYRGMFSAPHSCHFCRDSARVVCPYYPTWHSASRPCCWFNSGWNFCSCFWPAFNHQAADLREVSCCLPSCRSQPSSALRTRAASLLVLLQWAQGIVTVWINKSFQKSDIQWGTLCQVQIKSIGQVNSAEICHFLHCQRNWSHYLLFYFWGCACFLYYLLSSHLTVMFLAGMWP